MKRHAIFVDAGYVFAQGSVSLLGKNSKRTQLKLDEIEIIRQLKALALGQSAGVEILRIYWYDGARNGPTLDHLTLANMQDVKLRLGSINRGGEQKEVDSLLVTDLIDLARNQSICNATVVTGDSDVRIAVQIAQSFGVRVHLVGLEPSRASQSPSLRQEADTVHEITGAEISKFLTIFAPAPPGATPETVAPVPDAGPPPFLGAPEASVSKAGEPKTLGQILDVAIQRTLATVPPEDFQRLSAALAVAGAVPAEYDRPLLGLCRTLLGRDLTGDERREMRTAFKREILRLGITKS